MATANLDLIPRTLKLGAIQSPTSNASITIANTGEVTFTANVTFSAATAAANGYTILPGGVKLNWGWVSANSTTGTATFTSAYSSAVYSIQATANTAVATYQAGITASNTTTASIRTANATSTNVFWTAIGV